MVDGEVGYPPQGTGRAPEAPEIILFDDFESTLLKWTAVSGGPGDPGTVTRDDATAYNGGACMNITTGGGGAGAFTRAWRHSFLKEKGVVSTELVFASPTYYNIDWFYVFPSWDDGAQIHAAQARYTPATLRWEVLTPLGWRLAIQEPRHYGASCWHYLKLIIDCQNDVYVSLQANEVGVPLHHLGLLISLPALEGFAQSIQVQQVGAPAATLYVDDVGLYKE